MKWNLKEAGSQSFELRNTNQVYLRAIRDALSKLVLNGKVAKCNNYTLITELDYKYFVNFICHLEVLTSIYVNPCMKVIYD